MADYHFYLYTIRSDGDTQTFRLKLDDGDNILDKGYIHLQDTVLRETLEDCGYKGGYDDLDEFETVKKVYLQNGLVFESEVKDVHAAGTWHELKNVIVPMEYIYDRYELISIEQCARCEACFYGECGQIRHMECPDGCLHDPELCVWCAA